ncbi:chaplin [Streptomyces sp. NBC_00322]|uniref:chaplin n=1 Tax=Streptomyces sp. NBC_00322 TaxID=2975712 RepID=UPI002E2DB726|nr:chaplin [Streptomyces sp. NBC_00322]
MKTAKKAALILATAGLAAGSAAGAAFADAGAEGVTSNSPGVLSGNAFQVPVHVPATVCGNTVDAVGLLNPAFGNLCANG